MKFSIIIPVYNTDKYLCQCLESIITQTYKDIEIILIHDISGDNCGQICDDYVKRDNRIRVVHRQKGDFSSARNTGLDMATGEYILFVDSDDWIEKNYCEVFENIIKKNENCDIVMVCAKQEKNGDVRIHSCFAEKEHIFGADDMPYLQQFVLSKKYNHNGIKSIDPHYIATVWGKAYRKKCIEGIKFTDCEAEDRLFNLYAFDKCNKLVFNNTATYHYRINCDSGLNRYMPERVYRYEKFYEVCTIFINSNIRYNRLQSGLYNCALSDLITIIKGNIVHTENMGAFHEKREELRKLIRIDCFNDALRKIKIKDICNKKAFILYLMLKFRAYSLIITIFSLKNVIQNNLT